MDEIPMVVSPEVATALVRDQPVVAFETTILSFGLPAPLNQRVAEACEKTVRDIGAIPATLGLLSGKIHVGLSKPEIERFCKTYSGIRKVNLQNFAATLQSREPGALTVSASLQVCTLAGIKVFATGGIGGVHRGYAQTNDVSSDIVALSRYPLVTVCAGAKSILDVSATLELLETYGIPVVGFQTKTFPLFHARNSSHELDTSFDNLEDLGAFLRLHFAVSKTGVLVVTPVPDEHAIPAKELEAWITEALASAAAAQIRGKDVTPYILEKLEQSSGGRTVKANVALICNNARLAAHIANQLAD